MSSDECEHALAALASRSHAILAPRATTALVVLLRALDLPEGSEVLMPVMLCANPAHAVRLAGLCPVFTDISPLTFNLDLDAAERLVGPHTRVLLAVPLFGHPLDVPAVLRFAERHDLIVIEDAAQAVGLRYETQPAGSLGLCSVYSFGPGKISDSGGGAALLSDDPALLDRVRDELAAMPLSSRDLTEQAGRILASLQDLPDELENRARMVKHYQIEFPLPGLTHPELPHGTPLWKYSVLAPNRPERDRLTRTLIASGVAATNLYPPLSDFFPLPPELSGHTYPVARNVHSRIVNLPLSPCGRGGWGEGYKSCITVEERRSTVYNHLMAYPTLPLNPPDTPPREDPQMKSDDQVLERRLTRLRLSGPELSHSRRNNLEAVKRMVDGDPYSTFGIRIVLDHIRDNGLDTEDGLKIVSGITKCSGDINHTEGRGYISPSSTIKGLRAAAAAIRRVANRGGSVVFATGHPGSMINYYSELARVVRSLGGRVLDIAKGQIVFQGEDLDHVKVVDSISSIAFLSDTCGALHTHDYRPMELMLDEAATLPDLVIADHGFAGEAINRGIPTVAVMDTNDPGLGVAKHLGADLVLVPMNDNRPNVVTREAAEVVRHMALESGRAYR